MRACGYAKVRSYLFTFLAYPEVDADSSISSERALRHSATYRSDKITVKQYFVINCPLQPYRLSERNFI